jgi:hypothetical protein
MWSVTFEGTSNAPMNSLIAPAFGIVGVSVFAIALLVSAISVQTTSCFQLSTANCLAYFLALAASACECR